jgi:hypothetical protein
MIERMLGLRQMMPFPFYSRASEESQSRMKWNRRKGKEAKCSDPDRIGKRASSESTPKPHQIIEELENYEI